MKPYVYITILVLVSQLISAQEVPILSYGVDDDGAAQLEVPSDTAFYYVLYGRFDESRSERPLSMMMGEDSITTLIDRLSAFPQSNYRVEQFSIDDPDDIDNDGIDDVFELLNPTTHSPLNAAPAVVFNEGVVSVPNADTFDIMTYKRTGELYDDRLKDLEFVKFYMYDVHTDNPKVYFINTEQYPIHGDFATAVGLSAADGGSEISTLRGQIVFNPNTIAANGKPGVYNFEFQPRDAIPFAQVEIAHELLAVNMPFLRNNLSYLVLKSHAYPKYLEEKELYDNSRIPILQEDEIFGDVDYLALNVGSGYGLLRDLGADERPNPRDVVIYESLPNELPRVGGIITTVIQTPLSHVNLRAIQDNVPNAFIRNALENDSIEALIDNYVYYEVAPDKFKIRLASQAEIEAHYEDLRPVGEPTLMRDLSQTEILPLDDISFDQSSSFGVKCANLAAMRKFGFPEGVIPNGFGVPFYFYDEFMKYNGFYDEAREMLDDPTFKNSFQVQDDALKAFRDKIEEGDMPEWMLDALAEMQNKFPEGTGIRCRSSTNNEDLPGFNGAGLYDSKTQHIDEGHISKSVKEVYASMWNFRAFDQREFYRIDHLMAAMGVLVHPHFHEEEANGVGVTFDPFYGSENTFYINTQVEESLVTNPDDQAIAEEILLHKDKEGADGFTLVRVSNQAIAGELVLSVDYQDELRGYMQVIEDEFRKLYHAQDDEEFAIDIEYKVDSASLLVIKQARPWVGGRLYTSTHNPAQKYTSLKVLASPNPFQHGTNIQFSLPALANVQVVIYNSEGSLIKELVNAQLPAGNHNIAWNGTSVTAAPAGMYFCQVRIRSDNKLAGNVVPILKY